MTDGLSNASAGGNTTASTSEVKVTESKDGVGVAKASTQIENGSGAAPAAPQPRDQQMRRVKKNRTQKCRFFSTKKGALNHGESQATRISPGCRAGDECPFLHVQEDTQVSRPVMSDAIHPPAREIEVTESSTAPNIASQTSNASVPPSQPSRPAPVPVDANRIVQRPKPTIELQDPRKFQISQLKTRFIAQEAEPTADGTTTLTFKLAPSDPDFPFEIEALQCVLRVPAGFPSREAAPTLRVTNSEMERGFQINVERGFESIWAGMAAPTLLNAFKLLDRRLEEVLTAPKAETIKLVINAGPASRKVDAKKTESTVHQASTTPASKTGLENSGTATKPSAPPLPIITPELREQARLRRQAETEILAHRLGRSPHFAREADGTMFTVPLEPRKRSELPVALQSIKSVRLFVPEGYGIEPCSIELLGVDGDAARNVEKVFEKVVGANMAATLLAHVNYLAQNMHLMAVEKVQVNVEELSKPHVDIKPKVEPEQPVQRTTAVEAAKNPDWIDEENAHIRYIPRPPEWTTAHESNKQDDTGSNSSSYGESTDNSDIEEEDEDEAMKSAEAVPEVTDTASSALREKGVLISFPHMELHGIELLELALPSISVKCERCRDTMDFARIKNNDRGDFTGVRSESCKKCAFVFSIGYRKDIMHANSIRAGYLDLDGCTIVDLLPSIFTPTCSSCSTPYATPPGVVAVRGDSALSICRECHTRLSFRIPEVKFLHIGSAAAARVERGGLPRKQTPKENLGIVVGQELPKRGRCAHYSKSYRWFRFGCCSKVFPCDRCHDAESDHPNEFANRMICGFCSREQNYRPEECGVCRAPLTGRTGSGFWEGGKGTRDQKRMSRKDPRKYKRRPGSVVGHGAGAKK